MERCRRASGDTTATIICTFLPAVVITGSHGLVSASGRDLFLRIFEQARQRYHFVVVGYVVMPDHIHLLISEPERSTPSTVMQVVKQRYARHLLHKKGENRILSQSARKDGRPAFEAGTTWWRSAG